MMFALARRSLSFLLCGCGATCLPLASEAYSLENKVWPDDTLVIMQMELGTPTQILQDGSQTWNEAAVPAVDDWNAEMGDVQLSAVMDSTKAVSSGDGINSTSFASSVFGDSFGKGVLAVTYYRSQGESMIEADVLFNNEQTFDSYRGDLQFDSAGKCVCDLQRVFLHEMGHALGLDHPDSAGQKVEAIMNSVVSNEGELTVDDIAGIQSLYGPPTGSASPAPSPTPTALSRLVNISTRVKVGTGDEVLIGGFIIEGTQLQQVILRATGPSLGVAGVTGALQDPEMELYDSTGALLDANDNWQQSLDSGAIAASGLAPSDGREAAILARLGPGSYTAVISGVDNTTGIALVESYTLDSSTTHAANISTRGHVGTGDEVLIGGFIVSGATTKTIIVRALGPSLGGSGLAVLADPVLELHGANGELLAQDDDWASGSQKSAITATGLQPDDPREAALLADIPAGNYTAIVQGASAGTGIALVEIYDLDP